MVAVAAVPKAHAGAYENIEFNGDVVTITSPANTYALLIHPLALQSEPEQLIAELQVKHIEGATGASWGPGIYLYWDFNKWITIRLSNKIFRLEGEVQGSRVRVQDFPVTPVEDEWNGLRLIWRRDTVDVYVSTDVEHKADHADEATWHLLTSVNRPGVGFPWLMVGKGYAGGELKHPFLANSFEEIDGDVGLSGRTSIRRVRVIADGELVFTDGFSEKGFDESSWIPIVDGDPKRQQNIDVLTDIYKTHLQDQSDVIRQQSQLERQRIFEQRMEATKMWQSTKRGTNLLTAEQIEEARRTRRWPDSGTDAGVIEAAAARWMKYSLSELRDMVPGADIPRAFDVHFKQSPTHPEEIKTHGKYPWIIDPDVPYKVKSPVDGALFPTNDFDPKNPGGPEDVSEEPYVDTGWGWKDPNDPQKYWFVAYYAHWLWHTYLAPATETLGQAYIITGDTKYARQAAALLDRIADVYPDMDHVKQSRYGTEIQKGSYQGRIVNAIWETGLVKHLARAYDFIFEGMEDDPELQEATGKTVEEIRQNIERNILDDAAQSVYTMDGRIRGNFGMHHSTLATIAIVLDNDDTDTYVNHVLHATGTPAPSYEGIVTGLVNHIYRDGVPHESSPGYNSLWTGQFQLVTELMLSRGLNMYEEYPKLKRLYDMPFRLAMPGGFTPNIGDTGGVKSSGIVGYSSSRYAIAHRRYGERMYLTGKSPYQTSDNMSAYGLALLRRGDERTGTGLSFYYGQSGGHGHYDRLNIELFALGQRLMPDLGYPEFMSGYHKKLYGWTGHTLSHNTVLVNEERQHTKEGGRLQSFAFSPKVQYVDARAEQAYPGIVDTYRRALTMIDAPGNNAYVVDVFRVKGGNKHDYSLHGPDGDLTIDGFEMSDVQVEGTLAGEHVPFGYLYDAPQFERSGYSGSYGGYRGSGFSYLRNVRRGEPEGIWRAEWVSKDVPGNRLRVTFVPTYPQSERVSVVVADGEPPLNVSGNPDTLKYILERRDGTDDDLESTFVTIIEPYSDTPVIEKVRRLGDGPVGESDVVALAIERAPSQSSAGRSNGVDYVFQSSNPRSVFAAAQKEFQGRLGVVSRDGDNRVTSAYAVAARQLRQGDVEIVASGSYEGEISEVYFDTRRVTIILDARPGDHDPPAADVFVDERIVISNDLHATEYIVESARTVGTSDDDLIYELTLGDTEFLTAQGELSTTSVRGSGPSAESVLGSKTPLVLGPYYKGQWLVSEESGEGGRIVGFSGTIRLDRVIDDLKSGHAYRIYDFGPGDRFEIASTVYIDEKSHDEYEVTTNVPARIRMSDRIVHQIDPGTHTIQLLAPSVTFTLPGGETLRDAAPGVVVRGDFPVVFDIERPEGIVVEDVIVTVDGAPIYEGTRAPRDLFVDTVALSDGVHDIAVVLRDSFGRQFTSSLPISVENRWEEVDDLRPPIKSGWFSADFTKTRDRSDGWAYDTDNQLDFYGDRDRLVKTGEDTEFLVWDAPALEDVEITLYSTFGDVDIITDVLVGAAGGDGTSEEDEAEWTTIRLKRDVEGPNEAGWYQLHLYGKISDSPEFLSSINQIRAFRLVLSGSERNKNVQIGKVVLRGINI